MTKLLLISDNHGDKVIMEKIISNEDFDISVHLGDNQLSKKYMDKYFTYNVRGNHDGPEYDDSLAFEVEGKKIITGHGHLFFGAFDSNGPENRAAAFAKENNADIVIFGHSHVPANKKVNGVLCVNPGSCKLPRNPEGATYAVMTIDNDDITVEHKII